MKMKTTRYTILMLLVLLGTLTSARAQGILGIGTSGISGLPDTTHFGDTIRNMQVWVVNRGNTIVSGLTVQLLASPNLTGNPLQIGTLDLTLGLLQPGDSASVPLDYFVVSPSNSNNGSNVMVIWPTAPGTTPGDSAHQDYWVDGPTGSPKPAIETTGFRLFPNPCFSTFQIMLPTPAAATISLFAADGTVALRRSVHDLEVLEVSQLPRGIYLCRLEVGGKMLATKRIVLE